MDKSLGKKSLNSVFVDHKIHFIIFLFALLLGLTFTHPTIILNDEWITANQLFQLKNGHQITINEGKFGLLENGTNSVYFAKKSNILGYSLFLPLISLPSFWLIDACGEHFPFFILYLWFSIALLMGLLIQNFFKDFFIIRTLNLFSVYIVGLFSIFFINLFYYSSFPISARETYPEIMAIVFTNVLLYALLAPIIFEICSTLFHNTSFSVFSTVVCLSSSSYLFWTIGCKDHILVVLITSVILLCFIKYQNTHDNWYFPLAFLLSGFLAWARPEIAIWVFLSTCLIWGYYIFQLRKQLTGLYLQVLMFLSPLFTLIGALPFFFNNYLITKNVLMPASLLWSIDTIKPESSVDVPVMPIIQSQTESFGALQAIGNLLIKKSSIQPSVLFTDVVGIFFNPQNGSVGILSLTPVFLLALIILTLVILKRNLQFSPEEKRYLIILSIAGLSIVFAYLNWIHSMNTSLGIVPDIRYLSPLYIPLTLIGLLLIKKYSRIGDHPVHALKMLFVLWGFLIPVSLILLPYVYPTPKSTSSFLTPLNEMFSIIVYMVILSTVIFYFLIKQFRLPETLFNYSLILILALPLIWQVDAIFFLHYYNLYAGYTFWIPSVRIVYTWFFQYLFII